MVNTRTKIIRDSRRDEKKEYDFLLREFYELKNIFSLLEYAEEAKEAGQSKHLKQILQEILKKIKREERIEKRMNRVYQRMQEDIEHVEGQFTKSYPKVVKRLAALLEKAKIFNADLVKLDARAGQIEQAIKTAKKDPNQLNRAVSLVRRAFSDIQGFEQVVDELIHIDLYLQKQGEKLNESDLTKELEKMVQADQDIRSGKPLKGLYASMTDNVDVYNTNRLKEILKHHQLTKLKDVALAWIIVQHADHDPDFQEEMLKKLPFNTLGKKAMKNRSYLIDRVNVNRGKKQYYGTQARNVGNFIALLPIQGIKASEKLEHNGLFYTVLDSSALKALNAKRSAENLSNIEKYFKILQKEATGGFLRSFFFRRKQPTGVLMWLDMSVMEL